MKIYDKQVNIPKFWSQNGCSTILMNELKRVDGINLQRKTGCYIWFQDIEFGLKYEDNIINVNGIAIKNSDINTNNLHAWCYQNKLSFNGKNIHNAKTQIAQWFENFHKSWDILEIKKSLRILMNLNDNALWNYVQNICSKHNTECILLNDSILYKTEATYNNTTLLPKDNKQIVKQTANKENFNFQLFIWEKLIQVCVLCLYSLIQSCINIVHPMYSVPNQYRFQLI